MVKIRQNPAPFTNRTAYKIITKALVQLNLDFVAVKTVLVYCAIVFLIESILKS